MRLCCASSAARKVRQLNIRGEMTGISQLDEIIEEVSGMGLENDAETGEALLKRARIYNYVPSAASQDYKDALLEEYGARKGKR